MSRRPRRTHSATFKAKVALAAVRGDKTLAELAQTAGQNEFDMYAEIVARMLTDPVPAGLVAAHCVVDEQLTLVPALPPNANVVAPMTKFEPVMVTIFDAEVPVATRNPTTPFAASATV